MRCSLLAALPLGASLLLGCSLLVGARPAWAQAPDPPAPAAPGPYGYPAPYGYPPGYAYPPGYPAYPPGYPQTYPPAYPPYPAYPSPPAPPEPPPEPPAPVPTGTWRVGGTLLLIPQVGSPFYRPTYLSYDLRVRGESLLAHEADLKSTAGVAIFAEADLIHYVHLALAVQFLPWIGWASTATATRTDAFLGTGYQVDFLPQVGVTFSASRRLRVLGYVAPGYSLLAASGMADLFAKSGTTRGFALQVGGGILYAIGQHGFFTVRLSEQWSFLHNQVQSSTTGETADVYFRLRFLALHNSVGFWF